MNGAVIHIHARASRATAATLMLCQHGYTGIDYARPQAGIAELQTSKRQNIYTDAVEPSI